MKSNSKQEYERRNVFRLLMKDGAFTFKYRILK